jgi:hypothetical protein
MPKIIKSSSSTEKLKLETLHSPTKRSPTVIRSHEGSDKSKSKSSYKVTFWGSPNLSPGIETILTSIGLNDCSRSFIISISICNIKNMIQLSNLYFEDVSIIVSHKDLRDSVFQVTIIQVLWIGKCFHHLIQGNSGLDENEGIPVTFKQ